MGLSIWGIVSIQLLSGMILQVVVIATIHLSEVEQSESF